MVASLVNNPREVIPPSPRCPRCAYDLRGTVATWRESCPLAGTCTECGLALAWAETLLPEKFEPRWCLEFAEGGRGRVIRAFPATLARAARFFRFWSRLQMSFRVRPARLALFLLFLLALLIPPYVAVRTATALSVHWLVEREVEDELAGAARQIARLQRRLNARPGSAFAPDEMQRADMARDLARYQQVLAQPEKYGVIMHPVLAVLEAVLLPWRDRSFGLVHSPSIGEYRYVAPGEIYRYARRGRNLRWSPMAAVAETGEHAIQALGVGTMSFILMPAAYLLLPMTFRQARLRRIHLVRIAAYSLWLPVGLLYVVLILLGWGWREGALRSFPNDAALLVAMWGPSILLIAWWAAATGRYLRLRRAWLIAVATGILSLWAGLGVVYLVDADAAIDHGSRYFPNWAAGW